ncbi:MAG: hypothetical protein EBR02_00575 [Alphaproteobacteria bacterium]|nr:hypothetical protein [Alphaproteobacteria bacterium]
MARPRPIIDPSVSQKRDAFMNIPIRSSALARQMVGKDLAMPETREDIERYVQDLLIRKV